jgi:hypothetical protein
MEVHTLSKSCLVNMAGDFTKRSDGTRLSVFRFSTNESFRWNGRKKASCRDAWLVDILSNTRFNVPSGTFGDADAVANLPIYV